VSLAGEGAPASDTAEAAPASDPAEAATPVAETDTETTDDPSTQES